MKITCKCGKKMTVLYDYATKSYKVTGYSVVSIGKTGKIKEAICEKCVSRRSRNAIRRVSSNMVGPRMCLNCGEKYVPASPAQKYCPGCRYIVSRAREKAYKEHMKTRKYKLDETKVYA